ncbi:hypothetical protein ACTAQI_13850 [Pseudarthrobacter sp. alpha12b]
MGAKDVLKKFDESGGRVFYGALIALMLGVFAWLARGRILEAAPFLLLAVAYAVLLYRVVSLSVRAFTVMSWAFFAIFYSLISIDVSGRLGIPAAGPWFIGFIVGAIAGGYAWSGPRAGMEFNQAKRRTPEADGSFSGGRRLAVINGLCALVLLVMGAAQLMLLSPTVPAVAVLAGSLVAGWALFRFPPPLQVRNLLLLVIPVGFFVFGFIGGATDQIAFPHSWGFGVLAGILIGGRYWSGARVGAPRPPFAVQGQRRRRKRPRTKEAQNRTARAEMPAGK